MLVTLSPKSLEVAGNNQTILSPYALLLSSVAVRS